jgi:hypothetical protein
MEENRLTGTGAVAEEALSPPTHAPPRSQQSVRSFASVGDDDATVDQVRRVCLVSFLGAALNTALRHKTCWLVAGSGPARGRWSRRTAGETRLYFLLGGTGEGKRRVE